MKRHKPGKSLRVSRLVCMSITVLFALSCGSCLKSAPVESNSKTRPIRWMIFDQEGGAGRGELSGQSVKHVMSMLGQQPVVEYYNGDHTVEVSRMLALDSLPDIITVPAKGSLSHKIIASGRVWNIKTLSEKLYNSIPDWVREYYQNNSDELFSIPGGYTESDYKPVCIEGFYVMEEYYSLLGSPRMDSVDSIIRAVNEFVQMMTENKLLNSSEMLPIVFGVSRSGYRTVEHICGVLPYYYDGETSYHRIFSPHMRNVISFFDRLKDFNTYRIFESYSSERLMEMMKNKVFLYIGNNAFVEQFNYYNPRSRFIRIDPPLAESGFLEAQNRYGIFETFVSLDADRETVSNMLVALSSPEASRTLMYGIQDEHWVLTDGAVKPLASTLERMQSNMMEFIGESGIATFPFLSRDGYLNPYQKYAKDNARDLSLHQVFFSPSDYHGYSVKSMDDRLCGYYEEVAGISITAEDIMARIKVLSKEKEPIYIPR